MCIFLNLPTKIGFIGYSCKSIVEVLSVCTLIQNSLNLLLGLLYNISLGFVSLQHHLTVLGLNAIELVANAPFHLIELLNLLVYIPKGKN